MSGTVFILSTVGSMPERVQHSSGKGVEKTTGESVQPVGDSSRRIIDDIDGLLDEIDEVLDANAEEFVKNYVQKGGE